MRSIVVIIFIFVNSLFCQETYTLYVDAKDSKVTQFERELITSLFKLKNRKDGKEHQIKFIEMATFSEAFDHMKKNENSDLKNNTLAINEISFTQERSERFEFSSAYMFNKYTVMTLNNKTDLKKIKEFDSKYHYGGVSGSIFEEKLKELKKSKNIKYTIYSTSEQCYQALLDQKIDYIYSDFVDGWGFGLDPVFFDGDYLDKLCIIFPKGSTLAKEINTYLDYFIKSQQFYQIVKKHFGNEAVLFFKRSMKSK